MSILYNCHTDGTEWRITKFSDGEVESSYLCSTDECQCPAGHRPSCRHRLMLPMFIDRGAVNTFWFLDWERKGWVSNDYSERSELGSQQIERSEFRDHPELAPSHTDLMISPEAIDKALPEGYEIETPSKPSWRRI